MITDNALKVLEKRYFLKDKEGNVVEDFGQLCLRLAECADDLEYEKEYYDMFNNLEFLPNSPTIMNAGKPNGQLSACFVLPVEDSMEGIFDSIKNAALIHKSGGN